MKAGVFSRTDIPIALDVTRKVIGYLKDHMVDVSVETDTALALELDDKNVNLSDLEGDFIVTIGGDGTILKAAMNMKNPSTPLFGINMGRRGFLSEVSPEEIETALERVLEGDYHIEKNVKVSSRNLETGEVYPDALNEVLVASSLPSKMILLRLLIDGQLITNLQADGVLVSTPSGSTAYNLSAGGSIVSPGVKALSLTAICPYSYFKSLVFPTKSTVTVELLKHKADAMVIIDGRSYHRLPAMSSIEARVSETKTHFIRFQSYYNRVHKRLMRLQSK